MYYKNEHEIVRSSQRLFPVFDMCPYGSLALAYSQIQIPYVVVIVFKTSKPRLVLVHRLLSLGSAAAGAAAAKSQRAVSDLI